MSVNDTVDLLILPDLDIDLPIKTLMKVILFLIGHANIPDADFKKDIVLCEIKVLERFFNDEDLSEMIEMLQTQTKNPEVARVLEKYGPGFDTIYFDGKADGIAEGLINGRAEGFIDGRAEGVSDTRIVIAKNLLAEGCDEGFISRSTGLSIDEIKKLKRKL